MSTSRVVVQRGVAWRGVARRDVMWRVYYRYERLQADGPRVCEVSARHPLVPRYFTWAADVETSSLAEVEAALYSNAGALAMAHNGWVMDADPLQDFAARSAGARVYLRRELIAWGDSVKLR